MDEQAKLEKEGQQEPRRRHLNFDFAGLKDRAMRGPLRAAAFLGLSERLLEAELPRSLTLGGNTVIALLPDPIPDEMAEELGSEFRHWTVGNCLRELDQFLGLMLDECWDIVEACRIVSGEQPPDYEWRGIAGETNVAKKHKSVLEGAGRFHPPHVEDHEFLATLSSLRNVISHNLGVVDVRRAPAGSMKVRWLLLRPAIRAGGKIYNLDEVELPFEVPGDEGGQVVVDVVWREREFGLGDRATLTPRELLQIALSYQIVIERLVQELGKHARAAGVPFNDPPQAPHA